MYRTKNGINISEAWWIFWPRNTWATKITNRALLLASWKLKFPHCTMDLTYLNFPHYTSRAQLQFIWIFKPSNLYWLLPGKRRAQSLTPNNVNLKEHWQLPNWKPLNYSQGKIKDKRMGNDFQNVKKQLRPRHMCFYVCCMSSFRPQIKGQLGHTMCTPTCSL